MESDSGVSMTIKVSGLCRLHVDVLTISHNAAKFSKRNFRIHIELLYEH